MEAEDLTDESLMVTKWMPIISPILIGFVCAILIIGILSRAAMINFILKMASDRPISKNILLNQLIELPNFIIITCMILISLMTCVPIKKTFGHAGSIIFWIASLLHNFSLTIGECGLALYRLICIKDLGFALNIKKAEQLMKKIMMSALVIEASLTLIAVGSGYISNQPLALAVAQGHSVKMENIIHAKTKNNHEDLAAILIISLMVSTAIAMVLELICYISIYIELFINDEKIKSSISKNVVTFRRRRNVVSLSTQVIGVAVELISIVIGGFIVGFQLADPSVFLLAAIVSSSIVSAMHVLGSREMIQFYFHSFMKSQ